MEDLQSLRTRIDDIDQQIVELFRQRMELTAQVGKYKAAHGIPVLDRERERQVLWNKGQLVEQELRPAVTTLFQTIMALSRRQQRDMMGRAVDSPGLGRFLQVGGVPRQPVECPQVIYQGVPGAYSEQAVINFFGQGAERKGLEQFEDCFRAMREGQAHYAVLPIENSSTGAIRQIYDLLTQYECYMVGETTVKVEHCLMALKGATLDTITQVYSHEQGLFQCERYLNAHPNWRQVPQKDTAGSARMVAASGDLTKGAICSARAAELYGLDILAWGINDNHQNTTRFVVVSPEMELRDGADKISTLFVLPHQAGSLYEILTILSIHGLNMVKLESRPLSKRSWEYMFFLEFNGSLGHRDTDDAIQELAQAAGQFRVLGNFRSNLN